MGKRRGRPRKAGLRTKTDQLSRAGKAKPHDYGNIKVIERHSRFQHFIADKGREFEGTPAGRLWIVGAFDGHDIDPQVLRDCLLDYAARYWGYYPNPPAVANYTQENRRGLGGSDHRQPDPAGERFELLDSILRDCGQETRQTVHWAVIDNHFFPDEDAPWIARIINTRVADRIADLKRRKQPVPPDLAITGELARDTDWLSLKLLVHGALALARGTNRQPVSSAA